MSGTRRGTWSRPDPERWTSLFPHVPCDTATEPQADVAVHLYGDGFDYKIIAELHGVGVKAVGKHDRLFKRKVRDLLNERRPAVVTPTARRHDDAARADGTRAAALAAIREHDAIARLMATPPVPPVWRTRAGRLRRGVDPVALLEDAGMASRGDDESGQAATLTAGLDTIDLRAPGHRRDSLYRDRLNALRIATASWRDLVLSDDEAPRGLLEELDLLDDWRRRRMSDGRRHGRRRRLPQWSWAGDPDAAERRAAMLAETAKRRQLAESRAALLAMVPCCG